LPIQYETRGGNTQRSASILTLRNRLLLPKVRAFVDFFQQHWMHPRPPL
jgi:hypothetical protein